MTKIERRAEASGRAETSSAAECVGAISGRKAAFRRGRSFARLYEAPYALLSLSMLFWSGNFITGSAVRNTVPPVALAFWCWFGASGILIGFALPHLRKDWPAIRRAWPI